MTIHKQLNINLIELSLTDSTNNYLKILSNKTMLEEFTVVRADYQSAGKGQRGNYWEAEQGKNLLFSFLLKPISIPISSQFILSELVSLALIQSLRNFSDGFTIKWPNDIYWYDKKIAGILIEHDLINDKINKSIIGIGININQEEFVSNAPNPISLKKITGLEISIKDVLNLFLINFYEKYSQITPAHFEAINNIYNQNLYRLKGAHLFSDKNGVFKASIQSVNMDGTFNLLDEQSNLRSYLFKEVHYII